MPIQDLGPGEMGRRGLDRAQDAIELSRSGRERAPDGVGDTTGTEIHGTGAAASTTSAGLPANMAAESATGDKVELSVAARVLSAGEDPQVVALRAEHAALMRSAIDAGTLATPDRIERASQRMLGG
jgi:hypothetical protein